MPMHDRRPSTFASKFFPLALPSLLLPLLLAGCSAGTAGTSTSPLPAVVTGNWQVSSSETAAAGLPSLSGSLTGSPSALSGVFHSQSARACVAPGRGFALTGSTTAKGLLTLTGSLAGGTLTVTGTLAPDGKSITGASYNVAGGSCGFARAADAVAQVYTPLAGIYTGTFTDAGGQVAGVSATLNQSADANGDGNYTLSGSATPNNPCFTSPVPISNTTVTGGNFTFTYTDPSTTNSVTATGTFSADASTLNVTGWTSAGPCGPDSGIGSMTRH